MSADGLAPHKKAAGKSVPLTRRYLGLTCFGISDRKTETAARQRYPHRGERHAGRVAGGLLAERAAAHRRPRVRRDEALIGEFAGFAAAHADERADGQHEATRPRQAPSRSSGVGFLLRGNTKQAREALQRQCLCRVTI